MRSFNQASNRMHACIHLKSMISFKVLLLRWQANLSFCDLGCFDSFEMFSGEAEVTKYWKHGRRKYAHVHMSLLVFLHLIMFSNCQQLRSEQGYRCCKFDLSYSDSMDIDQSAGFVFLSLNIYIYKDQLYTPSCLDLSPLPK